MASASLAREKKIELEDIERDNLKSERKAKQESKSIASPSYTQSTPSTSLKAPSVSASLHYGFRPLKTPEAYVQRQQYTPVQYVPQYSNREPQKFVDPQQQYPTATYAQQQQYVTYQPATEASPAAYQQYLARKPQYVEQNQYQQYENVQYVTDNSLGQATYYTPQYVYVQPYPAASNNVQSVVDPKGAVQYVMYIPTPAYVVRPSATKAAPEQEYVNVVPQDYPAQYENTDSQYVQYVTPDVQEEPKASVPIPTPQVPSQKYAIKEYVSPKKEPKSLLDSYVPSYLQVQYYKQQQAQSNSIPQPPKAAVTSGKAQQIKTVYATSPQSQSASNYVYSYQYPAYAVPATRR